MDEEHFTTDGADQQSDPHRAFGDNSLPSDANETLPYSDTMMNQV
jgi:hypothetical protein